MKNIFITGIFFVVLLEIFSVLPSFTVSSLSKDGILSGLFHLHLPQDQKEWTELIDAAKVAQVDFIIFHGDSYSESLKHYQAPSDIDIFYEKEIGFSGGTCLTFLPKPMSKELSEKEMREMVSGHLSSHPSSLGRKDLGIFFAAAHPSDFEKPWNRFDLIPEGVEILNLRSLLLTQWKHSPFALMFDGILSLLNPYLSALRVLDFSAENRNSWDAMNRFSSPHFGFVGSETPTFSFCHEMFPWCSKKYFFNFGMNHVFVNVKNISSSVERKFKIYQAIREGRMAFSSPLVHSFQGNSWRLVCSNASYQSGDSVTSLNPGCHFQITFPEDLQGEKHVALFKNGEPISNEKTHSSHLEMKHSGPGAYRLEVYKKMKSRLGVLLDKNVPYVFYNPIYLQ